MTRRAICSVSCVALLTFFSATNAQGQQPHRSVTEVSMKNIVEGVLLVIMLAGAIGVDQFATKSFRECKSRRENQHRTEGQNS